MRWLLVALVVSGCYHPDPAPGAPCAVDSKLCPTGLVCRGGLCVDPATPFDAAIDARGDARVDARPLDAAPDALDDSIGCIDGSREAFTDRAMFPTIAGCAASWSGNKDLRSAKTGAGCGGAIDCAAPADACAANWHVCATSGDPVDLTARASAAACHTAGTGTFVAATSHCTSYASTCDYSPPYACIASGTCSEPVCCGTTCYSNQGCTGGAYPAPDTWISTGDLNGCGALPGGTVTGVMCCHD